VTAGGGGAPRLTGTVSAQGDAVVDLLVAGPGGQTVVPCVVDTGFTGALMLPAPVVGRLQLPRVRSTRAFMADGSAVILDGYHAEVQWLGVRRRVQAYASSGPEALIGYRLLSAHRLTIDYPARTVEIV
jgi:clan AA aspartic protease